jgi:hypothetical protein
MRSAMRSGVMVGDDGSCLFPTLAKLQTHDEPRQPPPLSIAGVILLPRGCPLLPLVGSVARFARLCAASLRSAAAAPSLSPGLPPWVGGSLRSVVCGLATLGR